MAKRSDFAQKLLDDLRLRKERMGAATSGQHSAPAPSTGDAYGSSRRGFRGSCEAASNRSSNKIIPTGEITEMSFGTRHHRAPSLEVVSQNTVPARRTRNNEQRVDVSMALALALSNTGKLQNIELFSNATVGKKHIMHHGLLNLRDMDGNMLRTLDQFPFLSSVQSGEISKSIQQLNTILRSCSNGLIFSRSSIDIGRELLKGAIDLEESLRMIVSLQDASDYMTGSSGKQIKLLKGTEDESSSDELNNMRLMEPRFSFDRSSKQSHRHVRKGSNPDLMEHKQMALSYPEMLKNTSSNSKKSSSNGSTQLNYHRRSLSGGPSSGYIAQGNADEISNSKELKNFTNDGNHSTSANIKHAASKGSSVCGKVRIPNVVAKLMGLEELPLVMPEVKKPEVQNALNPKQVKESSKIKTDAAISNKEAKQMTYSATKMKDQTMVTEGKGMVQTKAVNLMELVHCKANKTQKAPTKPEHRNLTLSEAAQFSISRMTDFARTDCCNKFNVAKKAAAEAVGRASTFQHVYKEKVEQESIGKATPDHITRNHESLLHAYYDDMVSNHGKAQLNDDLVCQQTNAREVDATVPQQQSAIQRLKTKHRVDKYGEKIEHNKRNKPHTIIAKKNEPPRGMKTEKGSSSTPTSNAAKNLINFPGTDQSSQYAKGNHNEQKKLQSRNFTYLEADRKSENEISEEKLPSKAFTIPEKEKIVPQIPAPAVKMSTPKPSSKKVVATELMRVRNENREVLAEENRGTKAIEMGAHALKQKTSFLHELEHRWKAQTCEAEAMVNSCVTEHHPQPPANLVCSSDEGEILKLTNQIITAETNWEIPQEEVATPKENCDTTTIDSAAAAAAPAPNPPDISANEGMRPQPLSEEPEGAADGRELNNCNSLMWQSVATSKVHGQGLLTKDEYSLKQILINSQHFLNTAHAIFKIKIPIGILQASENTFQYEGDKLVLHTGYELLRRKGKREEAFFSNKIPCIPAKMRCLDDLIRELNDDLRCLEAPIRTDGDNHDIAEWQHKMIERDVQNRNPDVNCMWDISWNSSSFANMEKEEIIRDVEKHVLNCLITDLSRDLMSVSITV